MNARLLAAVAIGAALGSLARYLVSLAALAMLGAHFPAGTLAANVAGSFLIALLARREAAGALGASASAFWLAGLCGGFTTFSVFSLETLIFIQVGRPAMAAIYVAASLVLWLGGAALGWRLGAPRGQ
ncbi:MAG: CrcB family protein [Rhizobiaceae bacterium]|nr:CrcB family protein [Rhizobiaceae bacterium]